MCTHKYFLRTLLEYLPGFYMLGRTHYHIKAIPVFHNLNQSWKNEAGVINFFLGIATERIVDIS